MKARELIGYLETLTVTQGARRGDPFTVLPWQRRFIRGAFAPSVMGEDVALSLGRGNGKTTFSAGLACAAVDPERPLHEAAAGSDVVIAASSFGQGKRAFRHVLGLLEAKGHDLTNRKLWRVQDSQNVASIEYRPSKVAVHCIGSDPARAHALHGALRRTFAVAEQQNSGHDRGFTH